MRKICRIGSRSARTLICIGCCGALRGTGPRTTGPGARFFVVLGTGPRDRFLILSILSILAILLQTECMRGTGPRTTVRTECLSPHRSAGACPPQSLPHPGYPDNPGHPASDAREIKGLTDLFCLLRLRSIDIQVLSDLVPSVGGGRSARACPSHAFRCLKRDGQDRQDGQDGPLGHTGQRSGRP